jgi:hypothetical protein
LFICTESDKVPEKINKYFPPFFFFSFFLFSSLRITTSKRMTLTIDDVVTHYVLSSHPKNKAIVDIKDKKSGDMRYIKIRHRLPKFYAVSLVDPVTFEVRAETQVKSASARVKPIVLHTENKDSTDAKHDTSVEFRESSRIVFEWVFSWEGEKYKWYVYYFSFFNLY